MDLHKCNIFPSCENQAGYFPIQPSSNLHKTFLSLWVLAKGNKNQPDDDQSEAIYGDELELSSSEELY